MIRLSRQQRGLSQRELARQAGVSYKTLQLIESGHDARWSTLSKIAGVLGVSVESLCRKEANGRTVEALSESLLQEGHWPAVLLEFVDDFRARPSPDRVAAAPRPCLDQKLLALLAAVVESVCAEAGVSVPWWCEGVAPLREPWFPAETENLKAAALTESPLPFRRRNIFVLGNFLSRA